MEQTAFEKQVIESQQESKKTLETLMKNYDNFQKETKQAMEDLTKAKNNFASTKDIQEVSAKMALLSQQLGREKHLAFGNPVQRLANNPMFCRTLMTKLLSELDLLENSRVKSSWLYQDLKQCGLVGKDLDSGNTPGSTYLAPNEVDTNVYDALLTYGAFRNVDVRQIARQGDVILIKTARAIMKFVDEAAAIGADATKAGTKHTVTAKKIAGLISTSSELDEDSLISVVQDIMNDFMESSAYRLDWITLTANGDADDVDGGFSGMFYGGTTKVAASGNVSVATLDYEDVLACVTGVDPAVLQRGVGKWFIHPTILAKMMGIKDGNGRPIFMTAIEAPSFGSLGTILGYPVVMAGAAPSTDSTSSRLAAFGDPMNQALRIRRGFTFDRSEHYAFNTDELTCRATLRAASKTKVSTATTVLTTAAS